MRYLLNVTLLFCSLSCFGQNGYIRLIDSDSLLTGFVRLVSGSSEGPMLEYWRTKNDKHPRKISKDQIAEYAIKKDTIRIIHNFRPFADEELYYERIETRLLRGKKINMLLLYYANPDAVSTYTGGGLLFGAIDAANKNYSFIYVLEDRKGYIRGIPPKDENNFMDALQDFFPARFLERYAEENGPIKYKHIPKLVNLYNSR
jgi:hypothetical protein